jgi:AcrR family transcriptional regulator
MTERPTGGSGTRTAHARIVEAAYDLFSRRGIRDVSVDEVIERAGIAKATLYRHFPSKTELVLAFLQAREQLLAIFDVFDDWFHREDFEACSFINVLLEMGASHPLGRASIGYLANIRTMVEGLASGAGLRDPVGFAKSWHILMKGSIISAAEGDPDAARRAQAMASALIDQHK